jgi:hypothetical protein
VTVSSIAAKDRGDGGGGSAMEEANFLSRFGSEVTVVHRRTVSRFENHADRARSNPRSNSCQHGVMEILIRQQPCQRGGYNTETGAIWEQEVDGFFVAIDISPTRRYSWSDRYRRRRLHPIQRWPDPYSRSIHAGDVWTGLPAGALQLGAG